MRSSRGRRASAVSTPMAGISCAETPDLTLQELSSRLHELHEVVAPISTIVERRGAWLLFLPPCSPDFNPMELAFSKLIAHMKRLKPRTVDDLW